MATAHALHSLINQGVRGVGQFSLASRPQQRQGDLQHRIDRRGWRLADQMLAGGPRAPLPAQRMEHQGLHARTQPRFNPSQHIGQGAPLPNHGILGVCGGSQQSR
jgi:hypothetical protein